MKRNIIKIILATLAFVAADRSVGAFLKNGMMRQYGLDSEAEILILGHSHIMLALDRVLMQEKLGKKTAKYAREGVTVPERKLMANHYLRLHPQSSLKYVIYGVDPYLFTAEGLSQNSYLNFLPFMDEPEIDEYVRQNTPMGEYRKNQFLALCRFSDAMINAGLSGWFRKSGSSLKTGKLDLNKTKAEIAVGRVRQIKINPEAVKCFKETIAIFTKRGIKVILLDTPVIDLYNNLEKEKCQAVRDIYRNMAESSGKIEYWDYNPAYESRYELFRDPIHLNRDGQKQITLDIIKKLESGNHL